MENAKETQISVISDENRMTKIQNKIQQDGGWGWIVCLVSLIAHGTSFGVLISFGVIYSFILKSPELVGDNSLVAFRTSWIGSLGQCVLFFTSICSGIFCDRFGIRQTGVFGALFGTLGLLMSAFVTKLELLYLTYGLVVGFGAGCLVAPSIAILGHYFKERIGLVSGIVSCGTSVYTFALSLTLPILLDAVNLKFTFITLAGLYILMALAAMVWIPVLNIPENTEIPENSHCLPCKNILRNRRLMLWILSLDMVLCGITVIEVHVVKLAQDLYPDADEFLLFTFLELGSAIARPTFGKISDLRCVNRIYLNQAIFFLHGTFLLCVPFVPSYAGLVTITTIVGVFKGGIFAMIAIMVFYLVETSSAARAVGIVYGSAALPITIGAPIAGLLYDKLGTYTPGFIGAGCLSILGSLMLFTVQPIKKKYQLKTEGPDSGLQR